MSITDNVRYRNPPLKSARELAIDGPHHLPPLQFSYPFLYGPSYTAVQSTFCGTASTFNTSMLSYTDIDIYLLLPLKKTDGVLISGDELKSKSMALYLSSGRS